MTGSSFDFGAALTGLLEGIERGTEPRRLAWQDLDRVTDPIAACMSGDVVVAGHAEAERIHYSPAFVAWVNRAGATWTNEDGTARLDLSLLRDGRLLTMAEPSLTPWLLRPEQPRTDPSWDRIERASAEDLAAFLAELPRLVDAVGAQLDGRATLAGDLAGRLRPLAAAAEALRPPITVAPETATPAAAPPPTHPPGRRPAAPSPAPEAPSPPPG
jgi:hypothetical protein